MFAKLSYAKKAVVAFVTSEAVGAFWTLFVDSDLSTEEGLLRFGSGVLTTVAVYFFRNKPKQ